MSHSVTQWDTQSFIESLKNVHYIEPLITVQNSTEQYVFITEYV